jgi:hypothetical protein
LSKEIEEKVKNELQSCKIFRRLDGLARLVLLEMVCCAVLYCAVMC